MLITTYHHYQAVLADTAETMRIEEGDTQLKQQFIDFVQNWANLTNDNAVFIDAWGFCRYLARPALA